MGEYTKFTGKTVEDALLEASIALGTTSDNIEYRVVEHESKGFLGIGAKKAVIEARAKRTDDDFISEIFQGDGKDKKGSKKEGKKEDKASQKSEKKAGKASDKKEKKEDKASDKKDKNADKKDKSSDKKGKDQKKDVKKDKPVKEEKKAASSPASDETPAANVTESPAAAKAETEKAPAAKAEKEERAPRVPADPKEAARRAETFLTELLDAMGIEGTVTTSFEDNTLSVNIEGDDMGLLIGKRGQTLDSVQYLTSLVVNKGKAAYVRVRVDTEDYRERRKATLENLARNMAFKVKKTRQSVYLEPMNPYERRIIHAALQGDPYVTTHSEGEEPYRKVVITLKKREAGFEEPEETAAEETEEI